MISRFSSSALFKPLLQLMSGAVAAQLIMLAAIPLLTRIYLPEQFGQFGVFMSLSGVLSAIFCLRFELAIYACRTARQALATLRLGILVAVFLTLLFSALMYLVVWAFPQYLSESLHSTVLFSPLAAMAIAVFLLLSNYLSWQQHFRLVAVAKVIRAACIALGQAAMVIIPGMGLMLGDIAGRLISLLGLCRNPLKSSQWRITKRFYRVLVYRHRRFIQISTPAALINVSVTQSPTVLLATFFSLETAGFYAVAQKLMAGPMVLVGQAAAQVYSSQFSRSWQNDRRSCAVLLRTGSYKLLLFSAPLMLLLALLSPWVFTPILGDDWQKVGMYVALLSPMFLAQLVVSPFINLTATAGYQGSVLLWDLMRLLFVVSSFGVVHLVDGSDLLAVGLFSLAMTFSYIVMFYILRHITLKHL